MGKRKLPFGYHIRDGQIQIKDNEAQAVLMIFDHYTAGMSYSRLTDKLNGHGVPYIPGKSWNKNMLARILQDERYMGDAAYPQIITPESFQHAMAARPDTSGIIDCAEIKDIRILARCGLCNGPMRRERKDRWQCPQCMDSPASIKDGHLILCVDRLLRRLHEKPETVALSPAAPSNDEAVRCAQDDFTHELDNPEFDETAATAKALALASAKFDTLDSADYETMRLQYILKQAEPHDGLNTELLRQIASAILIYPIGAVSLKLKNDHIIELHEKPETVAPSPAAPPDDEAVRRVQDDFTHELDKPEFDEKAATAKALALASARFNALGSADYETMRLQYILKQAEPHDGLDTKLLRQITSAILIYPTDAVSLKLKNNQIAGRSDNV